MACHNRREHTLSCLRGLNRQSVIGKMVIDVYLLDDGSSDGTSDAVRAEFPDVHLLQGDGNLFWTRGMYESFSAAIQKGYDYYLWLNDDSMLYDNALEVLLDTHVSLKKQGHECTIIGGGLQHPVTGRFTYGGVKRHKHRLGRVKQERIAPSEKAIQCDTMNGNFVLLPATVVERVGNLDPVYQHVGGDHDYCYRALQRGCSVWLAPGYLGTCEDNPIEGTWKDINLPMMERLRKLNSPHGYRFHEYAIYLRRHRGPWWPGHLIWPYIRIVLETIVSRSVRGKTEADNPR